MSTKIFPWVWSLQSFSVSYVGMRYLVRVCNTERTSAPTFCVRFGKSFAKTQPTVQRTFGQWSRQWSSGNEVVVRTIIRLRKKWFRDGREPLSDIMEAIATAVRDRNTVKVWLKGLPIGREFVSTGQTVDVELYLQITKRPMDRIRRIRPGRTARSGQCHSLVWRLANARGNIFNVLLCWESNHRFILFAIVRPI